MGVTLAANKDLCTLINKLKLEKKLDDVQLISGMKMKMFGLLEIVGISSNSGKRKVNTYSVVTTIFVVIAFGFTSNKYYVLKDMPKIVK